MKTCQTFELAFELNEMGYQYVYLFPPTWTSYDEHASIHSGEGKVIGHYDPRKKLWNFHNDRPLPQNCHANDNSLGNYVDIGFLNTTLFVNEDGQLAKEPVYKLENE